MTNSEINKKFKEILLLKQDGKSVEKEINALIVSCEDLIKSIVFKIMTNGCSQDELNDLMQEGRIGLLNAIDSYGLDKKASFTTYAGTCIKNKILDYLRKENNNSKNITKPISSENEEGEEINSVDSIEDPAKSPEEELVEKDALERIIKALNDTQKQILKLYLQFYSYEEIASKLGIKEKMVDNTIQKIRKINRDNG